MMRFIVTAMSCGGCAAAITRAIKAQDADASIQIDLNLKQVEVSSRLSPTQIAELLSAAGYAANFSEQANV